MKTIPIMTPISLEHLFARSREVVVLSPHSDDAAFSVSATIKLCTDREMAVTVINCFSVSSYSPKKWLKNSVRITAARKREDHLFASSFGGRCNFIWLDVPDAALRSDYPEKDACTSRPLTAHDLLLTAQLSKQLASLVPRDALIIIPFGIGFHPDHRIVREAGLSLLADGFSSVFFYEDLPYSADISLDALNGWITAFSKSRKIELKEYFTCFASLTGWKKTILQHYPSQVSQGVVNKIARHAQRLSPSGDGAERIWKASYCHSRLETMNFGGAES